MENPKPRSYFPTQFDPRHAPLTRSRIPHPSSAPKGEGPGSINLSSGQPSTDEKTTDHHHSSHNTPPTTYSERGDRYGKKSVGAPQELDPRKSDNIITSVPGVPVTKSRKPFIPKTDDERKPDEGYEESSSEVGYERGLNRDHTEMGGTEGVRLKNAGTARANYACSTESPLGTTDPQWIDKHAHQSVLQQHCAFFDRDEDGIIWPHDTYIGFHRIGFNIALSILAMLIIHINFSYPTCNSFLPDPFFRIFLHNIHRDKHGSDTGSYDTEGRFIPQKFEDFFAKYSSVEHEVESSNDGEKEKEKLVMGNRLYHEEKQDGGTKYGVTLRDVMHGWNAQRCVGDPIGWSAELLEWLATYVLLWPEDRIMRKEDIRKVYDGSIFYEIAERRAAEAAEAASKKQKNKKSGMESPKASIDDFVTQTKQAGGDIKAMLDEQINAQRGFLGNAGSRLGNAVSTVFSGKKAPEKTS